MMKYKNAQENKHGAIDCLILLNGEWVPTTQDPALQYELSEDLGVDDWEEIKPCDQAEKDAYAIEQANAAIMAELATLDATPRLLEEAALGDEYAINKLMELKERKDALRASLK